MPAHVNVAKRIGDVTELAFAHRATELGFAVAKPYGDALRYDFILDAGGNLWRIQVKTTCTLRGRRYVVDLTKHGYRPYEADLVAAHVVQSDAWYIIPVHALSARPYIFLARDPAPSGDPYEKYREAWEQLWQPSPPPRRLARLCRDLDACLATT